MSAVPALRPEKDGDADGIDRVQIAAFADHPFSQQTEHLMVRALREQGALAASWVVEEDGQILGHVAASPVHIDGESRGWFGLGPVAVMPSHQGRGLGRRLIEAALAQLRTDGAAGCVVLGDPTYYGRFGFRPLPQIVYPGPPPELFMALVLNAQDPLPRGEVQYHAAFSVSGAER